MDIEALKQMLASLDINPDEIEDERYATAVSSTIIKIDMSTHGENKTRDNRVW